MTALLFLCYNGKARLFIERKIYYELQPVTKKVLDRINKFKRDYDEINNYF